MNRATYIALCFSIAAHAAVVNFCPARRATTGDRGDNRDIVVLGVIELSSREQVEPTTPETPNETHMHPGHSGAVEIESRDDASAEPEPSMPSVNDEMPGEQSLTQGEIQNIRSRYLAKVLRALEKEKAYPPQAVRRGMEGTSELEFTIAGDGTVMGLRTSRPSQYRVLDGAARNMVIHASPFDPIPEKLSMDRLTIHVPVVFEIDNP